MSLRQAGERWVAANRTTAGWHEGWRQTVDGETAASLLLVPRGMQRVGEKECEDVGGAKLTSWGYRFARIWVVVGMQTCAFLILRMMGEDRRHFGGATQQWSELGRGKMGIKNCKDRTKRGWLMMHIDKISHWRLCFTNQHQQRVFSLALLFSEKKLLTIITYFMLSHWYDGCEQTKQQKLSWNGILRNCRLPETSWSTLFSISTRHTTLTLIFLSSLWPENNKLTYAFK